jgi:5-methylcytosine-specific restriction endonuclease McrA
VWQIVADDPISLFGCLVCNDPLPVRGLPDVRRLRRALDAARRSRPGDRASADLFCGVCTEAALQRLNEKARRDRAASEARIFELNRMPYAEYLLTGEWRNRRAMALAWAGHRCQVCNTNDEELHVHHRVYTRRGRERPEDLIVLCRTHHELFHGIEREAS